MAIFGVFLAWAIGGGLIVFRAWIIYKNYLKFSTFWFGILWASAWVPGLVIMSMMSSLWATSSVDVQYLSVPGLCAILNKPSYLWVTVAWDMFFQGSICLLLIYKAYQNGYLRTDSTWELMACLIIDGIFYNVVILGRCQELPREKGGPTVDAAMNILNLISFFALPEPLVFFAYVCTKLDNFDRVDWKVPVFE
ncbi:hypothetical protein DACRYDRAFT_104984 [Dacryopinax primogenitus]|uniref:Uncharacterized protein n=1 Tax=Dacryopinax primogenitus (strain DJM 731) TaxID=1858805 RepID=M5GG95_DACPD|nr:uncharacterized protein DACRYDRAFT_104984 [Dacryopinax primogenitus]EJU05098.1 hypothetical protein DACRYDRAFT_104984 [Dacryopinax primogenitus]